MLGEGLRGVKLVLVGVRELFPAQHCFLSPFPLPPPAPTLILLFLAQEKAYFPHEVTILATGSSLWGSGSCLARQVLSPLLCCLWSPPPPPDESFLLC